MLLFTRSLAQSCQTLCDPMDCSTPGLSVLHHLPELAQTHVHWVGDAIQPFLPPSICPSIRVFSNESALCIMWPKHWSFSFSISLSSEYSGLISFRMDWLDLFAVQRTLKSLLQQHSSISSVLRRSSILQCETVCSSFNKLSQSGLFSSRDIFLTKESPVGFSSECLTYTVYLLPSKQGWKRE